MDFDEQLLKGFQNFILKFVFKVSKFVFKIPKKESPVDKNCTKNELLFRYFSRFLTSIDNAKVFVNKINRLVFRQYFGDILLL